MKWERKIRLAGVPRTENTFSRRLFLAFKYTGLWVLLLLMFLWHFELHGQLPLSVIQKADRWVWIYFALQYTSLYCCVSDKPAYFKNNATFLVAVLLGLPFAFDALFPGEHFSAYRFVLLFLVVAPWVRNLKLALVDNRLLTTVLAALAVVLISGFVIAGLEPEIHSIGDGMWWALVTMSTVGYGDIVPITFWGRAFSGLLIFTGMGLFVVMTANFSALLLKAQMRDVRRKNKEEVALILSELETIKAQQKALEAKLSDQHSAD